MHSDVVYNIFINVKVHTAPSLTVEANSVNTALNFYFFIFIILLVLAGSLTQSTFVAPNALKVTDQMKFWKEGAKKKHQPKFLIGVLVNSDWQNY